jgi:hypothetical protein
MGRTPLHFSLIGGYADVFQLLLYNKADVKIILIIKFKPFLIDHRSN